MQGDTAVWIRGPSGKSVLVNIMYINIQEIYIEIYRYALRYVHSHIKSVFLSSLKREKQKSSLSLLPSVLDDNAVCHLGEKNRLLIGITASLSFTHKLLLFPLSTQIGRAHV